MTRCCAGDGERAGESAGARASKITREADPETEPGMHTAQAEDGSKRGRWERKGAGEARAGKRSKTRRRREERGRAVSVGRPLELVRDRLRLRVVALDVRVDDVARDIVLHVRGVRRNL